MSRRGSIGKKGIYDLVTTFLFIMLVLFVVLSVIYMGTLLNKGKRKMNDDIAKIHNIKDAKSRILAVDCLGITPKQERMHIRCNLSEGYIHSYTVRMLPYPNCTNSSINVTHIYSNEQPLERQVYFIGIESNETGNVCPGKLEVEI